MNDPVQLYLIAIATFLVAGTVKGLVGMGLPTTSIALLTLTIEPRLAIALTLIPMLASNAWQLFRAGDVRGALGRYWRFIVFLVVTIALTVWATRNAPQEFLLGALGVIILIYVAMSVSQNIPPIPDRLNATVQTIAGIASGIIGGLVGVWAPPMGAYLAARQVSKDEFVRATGLILLLGSIPLTLGYIQQGFLTWQVGWFGLALLIPTFAGFALGERLRSYMSEAGFRRILLIFFAVLGLNLLRRAVF